MLVLVLFTDPIAKTQVQQASLAIRAIKAIADDMGRQDISGKLGESVESMTKFSTLKMGVVGTTSSGKSTTLNALLGKKLLPASFKPETASLVCIKHDPKLPAAVLYGWEPSAGEPTKIDTEDLGILGFIKEENDKHRSSGSSSSYNLLELCVSIPFLEGEEEVGLEIYDMPGTSEAGNKDITETAKHELEKLDGIILILAADSAYLKSSVTLLDILTDKYPLLMKRLGKDKRILLLVNKYDVMFDDGNNPSLDDERQQLAEKINVAPEDIEFFSARLGLKAMLFKNDPNSVDEISFDMARSALLPLPEKEIAMPIRFSTKGCVNKLGEVLEISSRIRVVETMLTRSCTRYRTNVLIRKAVDESQCQVTVLQDHAEQEIKMLSNQNKRYEMIRQQLLEQFPEEVDGEVSTLLRSHITTVVNEVGSYSNTQLGLLVGTKDSKNSVSNLINAVRSSLIAVAEPKLSETFMRALNDLQARLSILFGQTIDQLTKDLSEVEGGTPLEVLLGAYEKFQHPTFVPDVAGHKSIDTATLHSRITTHNETRTKLVSKTKRVRGPLWKSRKIHYTDSVPYTVTVYKASIDDLNDSFHTFSRYCGEFLREKIEAVLKEQTRMLAHDAAEEVLRLSGQPEWEDWLKDGEGQTKRCDEYIERWENRKASLDEAEKKLEEI